MAMGSTSRVVLNDEMQKAKESNIQSLFSAGFQGEAADGFREFYDKNVGAFFAAGGTFDLFMSMFDKDGEGLFDSIYNALINAGGLDPSLGENNRSVGQQEG